MKPKLTIVEKIMFSQNRIDCATARLKAKPVLSMIVDVGSDDLAGDKEYTQNVVQSAIDQLENNYCSETVIVLCSLQLMLLKDSPFVELYNVEKQIRHIDSASEYVINEVGNFSGTPILLDSHRLSNSKPIQVFSKDLDYLIEVKINGTIRLF